MIPDMSVSQEKADRQFQRDKIAALFRLHPLEDIEPEILKSITPHYQQRISECRRELGMWLENRSRWAQDRSGTKHRLDGAYCWYPDGKPLGRDAGQVVAAGWSTKHGRPFEADFKLTP